MPKKFADTEKVRWLDYYEKGKTEKYIAREVAKCDVRTVMRGIEEARQKRDMRAARAELVKDALRKHQDTLLEELDRVTGSLFFPPEDYTVLSWNEGGDSILARCQTPSGIEQVVTKHIATSRSQDGTVRSLLKQHLKHDKLWKLLAQWEKAYANHLTARTTLQCKITALVQEKTGVKMFENNRSLRPFLYCDNIGQLFFGRFYGMLSVGRTASI